MPLLPKVPLWDGQAATIKDVPDAYLVGCLRRMIRRGGHDDETNRRVALIVAEARRRQLPLQWAINRLDPPPCHCGRKGLYIVGSTTYCSQHRQEAANHRFRTVQWLDQLRGEKAVAIAERERMERATEWHHRARGRLHRPKGSP